MPARSRWFLLTALVAMVAPAVLGGGCAESHRLPASENPSEERDAAAEDSAPPVVANDGAADSGKDAEVAEDGEWIPLPGLGICFGARLNFKKASWPKRVWESCGTGCRVGPASVLPDHLGQSFASGAKLFQASCSV